VGVGLEVSACGGGGGGGNPFGPVLGSREPALRGARVDVPGWSGQCVRGTAFFLCARMHMCECICACVCVCIVCTGERETPRGTLVLQSMHYRRRGDFGFG
jgi:hypothetical protein